MSTANISFAPAGKWTGTRNLLVIASPIFIVLLGTILARVSVAYLGIWAWALTVPVYWAMLSVIIFFVSGREKWLSWFGKPRGSKLWLVLALVIGLSAFPLLLFPNVSLLRTSLLTILWFAFGLINGVVEESYWRGFLFNEIRGWPLWLKVSYSSVFFVALHFLMLGAFSAALFNLPFLVILVMITLALAQIYIHTGSLRWPVVSHILADWGNMNIFVFMNLIKFF